MKDDRTDSATFHKLPMMFAPRVGSVVFEVNDHKIGTVARVNPCCIEVHSPEGPWALKSSAIFDVNDGGVTLICNSSHLSNYICGVHQAPSPPAAAGT